MLSGILEPGDPMAVEDEDFFGILNGRRGLDSAAADDSSGFFFGILKGLTSGGCEAVEHAELAGAAAGTLGQGAESLEEGSLEEYLLGSLDRDESLEDELFWEGSLDDDELFREGSLDDELGLA